MIHEEESPKQGCSKPVTVTASNGKQYILKNNMVKYPDEDSATDQDAEFFQEALVSEIATKLDVPTPNYVAITIDSETLASFPNLRWKYQFSIGKYFATEKLPNIGNDLLSIWDLAITNNQPYAIRGWHKILSNIINKNVIPSILCLDFYTLNFDRFTNAGNILFQYQANGKWIVSIDYGMCFSNPYWKPITINSNLCKKSDLLNINNPSVNPQICQSYPANMMLWFLNASAQHGQRSKWKYGFVFDSLQREISFNDQNPFNDVVTNIETISDLDLVNIIGSIPSEWVSGGNAQKEAYTGFLNRQKGLIKPFIEYNITQNMFTNYKGGQIEWHRGKNINTQ